MFEKKWFRKLMLLFGTVIWIGALGPEIFTEAGEGCIFGAGGRELTPEEVQKFMEVYFYGNAQENTEVTVTYKFALLDLFQ